MRIRHVLQAAALPIQQGKICLVTSSSGKRWVIPKGRIDAGFTAEQAAITEAWEEAGLIGELFTDSPGSYQYQKYGLIHHVSVFILAVTEQRLTWPEHSYRTREWVPVEVALTRIEEPKLRSIIRNVFRSESLPWPTAVII